MDNIDQRYRDAAEEANVPLDTVHELKPDELQILSHLARNRDRVVAQAELAVLVFGQSDMQARRRVCTLTSSVRRLLRRHVRLKPTFTRYRGELAVGLRWHTRENANGSSAQAITSEQTVS